MVLSHYSLQKRALNHHPSPTPSTGCSEGVQQSLCGSFPPGTGDHSAHHLEILVEPPHPRSAAAPGTSVREEISPVKHQQDQTRCFRVSGPSAWAGVTGGQGSPAAPPLLAWQGNGDVMEQQWSN